MPFCDVHELYALDIVLGHGVGKFRYCAHPAWTEW